MWDSYLGLAFDNPALFWSILAGAAGGAALLFGQVLPWGMRWLLHRVLQDDAAGFYSWVVQPQRSLLVAVGALGMLDLGGFLLLQAIWYVPWYPYFEFGVTLAWTVALGLFLSRCFQTYFDTYLLNAALKGGRKTNSEILVLGRFFANFGIIINPQGYGLAGNCRKLEFRGHRHRHALHRGVCGAGVGGLDCGSLDP